MRKRTNAHNLKSLNVCTKSHHPRSILCKPHSLIPPLWQDETSRPISCVSFSVSRIESANIVAASALLSIYVLPVMQLGVTGLFLDCMTGFADLDVQSVGAYTSHFQSLVTVQSPDIANTLPWSK
jgi:hypothetical protein